MDLWGEQEPPETVCGVLCAHAPSFAGKICFSHWILNRSMELLLLVITYRVLGVQCSVSHCNPQGTVDLDGNSGVAQRLGSLVSWDQNLALMLPSCMTLGKLPNHSVPWFPLT